MQACARTRRAGEGFHAVAPRQLNARFGQLTQRYGSFCAMSKRCCAPSAVADETHRAWLSICAGSSTRRPTTITASSFKREGDEVEIGSIGIQHGAAWRWGIDTVIPMRVLETQGKGKDRRDCMRQFRAAWDHFAADEANLTEFLNAKRKRR